MSEPVNSFRKARRGAVWRNVLIGTLAAFAGGAGVVGFQTLFALASARYPPIIQGLHCNFTRQPTEANDTAGSEIDSGDSNDEAAPPDAMDAQPGRLLPAVTAGNDINCYLDAPGADYAAWVIAGRRLQFRSGPLDLALPCQDGQAFSNQSPDNLRLSACQTFRLTEQGEYSLVAKVLARGFGGVDREQINFMVRRKPPVSPAALEPPVSTRLKAALVLPGQEVTLTHKVAISESLSAHGLLPTSREYGWVAYRLAPDETYVSSRFQANSASNASRMRASYQPTSRSVGISFTLRSGPFIDRWRGWISGAVVVQVRRLEKAETIDLPDIDLHVPGQAVVALPDAASAERLRGASIQLQRTESGHSAAARLDQAVALDNADIVARADGGQLVIDARLRGHYGTCQRL
jgi:hypothetical protein